MMKQAHRPGEAARAGVPEVVVREHLDSVSMVFSDVR